MSWYKTGTISVTNGSTTITGSGTAWIANAGVGEALLAPDGRAYEIAAISADGALTLGSAYLGSTASGQAYAILPSQAYIRDLAAQAAALVNAYATIASNAGAGKFGDGTLSAPGISFTSDLDTGIRRTGSGTMALVSNGADRVTVGPSGVSVAGAITTDGIKEDASGNIGIGTSTANGKLTIKLPSAGSEQTLLGFQHASNTETAASFTYNQVDDSLKIINTSNFVGSTLQLGTGGSTKVTLDNSGNLLVGATTSSPNPGLFVSPAGYFSIGNNAASSGFAFGSFLRSGVSVGSITQSGTTAVAYNTTSDHRLKTNVRPADAAKLMDIEFVDFEWIDGRHDCGVIAGQLQSIYPDLVTGEVDATEMRAVEISPAIPAVTEQVLKTEAVLDDGGEVIAPAVYETVEITPAVPAVTEEREFPVYQQVNYLGLIGRMGTRVQQLQRTVDAQESMQEYMQAMIESLLVRVAALEASQQT